MNIHKKMTWETRRGFTLVELLVVIAIIAALAGLSYGPVLKQLDSAKRTEAIVSGRSINTSLLVFFAANDRQFPNDSTSRNSTPIGNSHEAFQQLINSAIIDDEKFFWNSTNGGVLGNVNEPINDGTLNQIENVWNYVMNVDASDGDIPIIFDSIDTGTTFTAETWDGRAIIGYVDGSVVAENIAFAGVVEPTPGEFATGPINAPNGSDLFAASSLPNGAVIISR